MVSVTYGFDKGNAIEAENRVVFSHRGRVIRSEGADLASHCPPLVPFLCLAPERASVMKLFVPCAQKPSGTNTFLPPSTSPTVLVKVTTAVMRHHELKQLGEGRVYVTHG